MKAAVDEKLQLLQCGEAIETSRSRAIHYYGGNVAYEIRKSTSPIILSCNCFYLFTISFISID